MGQTSQIGFGAMGATQSLVVETVGEQSETKAAGVVELFFRKAGKTRYLNAGECFIKEGEVVGSVFLVMGGEVLLKKQEKGSAEKLIATRSKGSLLGELSFMLGLPATVSAFAAPSKSSDPSTSSTPVTIIDVPQVKLMETLKKRLEEQKNTPAPKAKPAAAPPSRSQAYAAPQQSKPSSACQLL